MNARVSNQLSDWSGLERQLRAALISARPYWQAEPYHLSPGWRDTPTGGRLQAVLALLDDATVMRLAAGDHDDRALWEILGSSLPVLGDIEALLDRVPAFSAAQANADDVGNFAVAQARLGTHGLRDVPGRKLAQVAAFADALELSQHEWVEWCAGKGHLGRVLAAASGQAVFSVELDDCLCDQGRNLAQRERLRQSFVCADVLRDAVLSLLCDRHVVALHACGDLHRRLVQQAGSAGVRRVDLTPCCYQSGCDDGLARLLRSDDLSLTEADLRLAVTGHATASAAEQRSRQRLLGWKFAYRNMADQLWGEPGAALPASRDVPRRATGFAEWCAGIATANGRTLPNAAQLAAFERAGERAAADAARWGLVRLAFRRAIEVWLVLRLVLELEAQGFAVQLRRFCSLQLTPRNLLISAQR